MTFSVSYGGLLFRTAGIGAYNPGFTVGGVGFFVSDYSGAKVEALFDWIRFT